MAARALTNAGTFGVPQPVVMSCLVLAGPSRVGQRHEGGGLQATRV
jgi:hypothetical protein